MSGTWNVPNPLSNHCCSVTTRDGEEDLMKDIVLSILNLFTNVMSRYERN